MRGKCLCMQCTFQHLKKHSAPQSLYPLPFLSITASITQLPSLFNTISLKPCYGEITQKGPLWGLYVSVFPSFSIIAENKKVMGEIMLTCVSAGKVCRRSVKPESCVCAHRSKRNLGCNTKLLEILQAFFMASADSFTVL